MSTDIRPGIDFHVVAQNLIQNTIETIGRCTLQCSYCAGHETYIDADAVESAYDADRVNILIQHAMFDHTSRADVVAIAPVVVLRPQDLA